MSQPAVKPKYFKPSQLRVGVHVFPSDPYWVQIRAAVMRNLTRLGVTVVPIDILENDPALATFDPASLEFEMRFGDEEIRAKNIDVLVSNDVTDAVAFHLLESGLPIVYLAETPLNHRRLVPMTGLYDVGRMAGGFIKKRLCGRGRVLCLGGLLDRGGDRGISRINGFYDALKDSPGISVTHAPSYWTYEDAFPVIEAQLRQISGSMPVPDAIFALSDSLALAARDAARALRIPIENLTLVGVNGDPLALVAIAEGSMTATIETSPEELGQQAAELAAKIGQDDTAAYDYRVQPHLITRENVFERGMKKLYEIAELPNQLVGVNRQREQVRLLQLETSIAINRRVGTLLDPQQLSQEIANLIGDNYGYDVVQLYLWLEQDKYLLPYESQGSASNLKLRRDSAIPIDRAGLLGEAIFRNQPVYISDSHYVFPVSDISKRLVIRSRLVLPIHLGDSILGVLDLQSQQAMLHLRQDLVGLQALADQLGITMRNAELYNEALHARVKAETADRLKSRLLANVSHELRTPLNIMMGYSQLALKVPNPYQVDLPPLLRRDLEYVLHNGEHLQYMINDLLDLSRAEIDALELNLEVVKPGTLLSQAYESFSSSTPSAQTVSWRLAIPAHLPLIHADPVRLRQIFLNLLSNANKFTNFGHISLEAEVEPPYLHVWVQDTGSGIPLDQQEHIFEPFITIDHANRREKGIGLGLAITRRLVALHGGILTLESQPGVGSVFHVYLPLPDLTGEALVLAPERQPIPSLSGKKTPVLLFISSTPEVPEEIASLAKARRIQTHHFTSGDEIDELFISTQPVALAWNLTTAIERQSSSREWSLIQRLRSRGDCARLPLLVYAGTDSVDVASDPVIDHGLIGVMLKPLNSNSLSEMIASLPAVTSSKTVWIVDDDLESRDLYKSLVAEVFSAGDIITTCDGPQALAKLSEIETQDQAPGLVLLDLMMPEVDGFQVLSALRSHPLTMRVPVLVLSGKILTFEDVQRLNLAYVSFQPKQLLERNEIQTMLQQVARSGLTLSQPKGTLARHALAYLMQNYTQPLTRSEVAHAVGVTESYLTLIFRQEVGITPWEFINRLRISNACGLLKTSTMSITQIAGRVGFNDSAYFSRVFHKQMGCAPQHYREQFT